MSKLNISRIFDVSKYLSTKAGQELADVLEYISSLSEQILRALRNGLSFADNFDAIQSTVSLTSGVASVVGTSGKRPIGIVPMRIVSTTSRVDSFGWYLNDQGQTVVTATFTGSPTTAIDVVLVIFFS